VGTWFLLTLPTEVMKRFMGSNMLATGLLAAGILLSGSDSGDRLSAQS
jgi:hypothetical protein